MPAWLPGENSPLNQRINVSVEAPLDARNAQRATPVIAPVLPFVSPSSRPRALRVPAWLTLLAGSLLLVLGVGVLAWDYAQHAAALSNYGLFWLGMALCLAGTLTMGLRPAARGWEHVYALGAFGAALWLPYFLRSPVRLIFPDELYHYQIAQLMLERGHTDVPVLQYPIPGEFPGIELVALHLMSATGLSIDVVVRLVTLLIHILIPLLA